MPIDLAWHDSQPVLMATYRGDLSSRDVRALVSKRATMLNEGPSRVIVVADVKDLETLPESAERPVSVLSYDSVTTVLVILPPVLNDLLKRTGHASQHRHRVYFCADVETALAMAADLLQP